MDLRELLLLKDVLQFLQPADLLQLHCLLPGAEREDPKRHLEREGPNPYPESGYSAHHQRLY
jgi:hypothetical protein